MRGQSRRASLDHLVGAQQECLCDRQAKYLCGLEIDGQVDFGRLRDGDVGWLGALKNLVDVISSQPELVDFVGS
jgi:hypothetical protein